MLEGNMENIKYFKRVHVGLVILFSFLSLGIYLGYWFLSRKKSINDLKGEKVVPFKWWVVFTTILTISFVYKFVGPIFLTPYGMAIFDSIDVILSCYLLGLLYYSVFRLAELFEETYNEKIFQGWLLVLFHVWYVQYKINRLGDFEIEESRFTSQLAK
ncbi:hypothetical protein ACFYKX_25220 [Cytobacillus sp. FJAT-54145]|uniref:DUF4234 domain-containing protein n=1 Tax=Cytobacillus spartinae TaxID=3299023 RepID=A0ABW6KMB3_9BACI